MPGRDDDESDPAVAATQNPEPRTPVGAAAAAMAQRAPRSVRPGDVVGRYAIGDELGEGGMATVFRARDRELRRDVAVKVLFPHLAKRVEIVRRFQREARTAAGLEHPNILRIYDVGGGDADDPPYIVMELIRGRTLLAEIEQRGPILAEVVACIGALLADALGAAHAAGVIHRDVKPSNVLIAQGGRLLLADFGVARLETEDSLVTRTGALLGTPAYMSPEQASGDTATTRSDLYSLGATLYQLSTGLLPYSGSPAKVMSAIATGQFVPPVRRRAAVGPELSRAIEQMMEAEQTARPASAAAVAAELRQIAAAGGLGDPVEELAAYFEDPEGFLRARTPTVVRAIVAAGRRAIADDKLPRAMALADRASALAAADPDVVALVEAVTEGGRATGRRRVVALVGAGLALAAGGAAAVIATMRGGDDAPADAAIARVEAPVVVATAPEAAVEPPPAIDAAFAIDAAPAIDAGRPRRADAAPPRPIAVDAQPMIAVDAVEPVPVAIDAPELGRIHVENDLWCQLFVDGVDHGRITSSKELALPAGKHRVTCTQGEGTGLKWSEDVDVQAGKTVVLARRMTSDVEVVVATAGDRVIIDDTPVPRGQTVRLAPGQHRVTVMRGDTELTAAWVQFPRVKRCRLRELDGRPVCQ